MSDAHFEYIKKFLQKCRDLRPGFLSWSCIYACFMRMLSKKHVSIIFDGNSVTIYTNIEWHRI